MKTKTKTRVLYKQASVGWPVVHNNSYQLPMAENDRYRILTGVEFINYTKHNNLEDNTIKHGYLGDFGDTIEKIRELPGEKTIQIDTYDPHNPHIDWMKFEQLESMNEMAQVINNIGEDPNFKVTISDTTTITVVFKSI